MLRIAKLSLVALSSIALLATKAVADELEHVAGEVPPQNTETKAPTGGPAGATTAAVAPVLSLGNYKTEALLIALAIGLVANYFHGSRKNLSLSKIWEKPISEVLHANFSLVGDGKQVFERDSAADMLFYASGRRHCKFAQGHMVLKARQDAIALLNDLAANNQERLEIEITLNDDEFSGFVFAAVPQKRSKAVGRDRYDISTLAKVVSSDKVAPKVVLFSENGDVTSQMLESGLSDILADERSLLEEIYVSDTPTEKPESHEFKREKKLTAVIRLPEPTDESIKKVREILEFVFYLVDYISETITLRPEAVRKLTKARDEAFKEFARVAEQEKQDALAKTLAEKRRIELEEVAKMAPEQRRKWEEKDRKKQLKKEQSKRVRRVR
ncbi:hypothetical protein GGI25_003776 [Coemansia spiralis]|uniref:DUF1682-domain-containing protein n=2 Tax=Coemansia TaxID=4863 RepID=A0A9W8G1H2_9FUNG|nr:hypothetical protein BX070DRAFT_250014 [Coemansia spiralis]KAJ1994377.1 hypothetical protein EDC05_001576 [Coemansia umbellata]KAJ2624314.1 hypothetical protein GGI26_001670 [Coemansia sp. RSA 1358]KAJ2675939.1 hypothetical protein GGI25_003776 [Coemansia spiralis]